jgi:type II secretory pathway pseudopilin PulG
VRRRRKNMSPEYTSLLSLLVSLIAAMIAATSLVRSRKLAQRQLELQAEQQKLARAQLELARAAAAKQERAEIVLSLERYENAHRFYLRNRGAATARNVDLAVASAEGKTSPVLDDDYRKLIPVREMPPGHEVAVWASLTMGTGVAFDCAWSWDNADGSREERRGVVTPS